MDLKNKKILVTRSSQHAEELLTAIKNCNGQAICQPLFTVVPTITTAEAAVIVANSRLAGIGIFISRNAVDIVMPILDPNLPWLWAAIGPGTAQHLTSFGVTEVLYAQSNPANSRTMLDSLLEAKVNLDQTHIMLFTGAEGDPWLATRLQALGANVDVIIAYRRELPKDLQLDRTVDIVLITCMTSLVNLQTVAADLDKPLLVVSERIRSRALEMGYSTVYTTKSMADIDIIAALMKVN